MHTRLSKDYQQNNFSEQTDLLANVAQTIKLACNLWDSSSFSQSVEFQKWIKGSLPMILLSRAIINTPTMSESDISTRGNPWR